MDPTPRSPTRISPHARACLEAVAAAGLGEMLSVGGAFGLAYYHEYRSTADVDAWWSDRAGTAERRAVLAAIAGALGAFGATRERSWGDVASIELFEQGRVAFSFQIAARSVRLRGPLPAPWPPGIRVDHPDDLLASKMEALVNRGAPRDFRDVHELSTRGLTDPGTLWRLWAERRAGAGEEADTRRARLAILTHLERIEHARPLESIPQAAERDRALSVRRWVREELLRGLV